MPGGYAQCLMLSSMLIAFSFLWEEPEEMRKSNYSVQNQHSTGNSKFTITSEKGQQNQVGLE
jgi:hypothetical protein